MEVSVDFYDSPCGRLILGEVEGCLVFCDWAPGKNARKVLSRLGASMRQCPTPLLEEAFHWLDSYFAGCPLDPELPVRLIGTPFRIRVWEGLKKVVRGQRVSYSIFTSLLGLESRHTRAVASAIGANPLSIFLPCHRIVAADGKLAGYAGGLGAKKYLLNIES